MTQALVDHYVGVGERLKVMVRAYEARMGRLPTRQSDIGPECTRNFTTSTSPSSGSTRGWRRQASGKGALGCEARPAAARAGDFQSRNRGSRSPRVSAQKPLVARYGR